MDIKKLKQLIKLAKEENVARLEFEDQNFKYGVTLNRDSHTIEYIATPMSPTVPVKEDKEGKETSFSDHGIFEVKSPFVGTFYSAPSPEEPPFVKIGDKVNPGCTLCILEAMKIMNEIDAGISGEVVEICVENEDLVEYNQVLFKIRK